MDIEAHVRDYVVENFLLGEGAGLTSVQSLLETGVVDSTGVLELVTFLEERYGITVADEEMIPENLDSIANISVFVGRKLDARESSIPKTARGAQA